MKHLAPSSASNLEHNREIEDCCTLVLFDVVGFLDRLERKFLWGGFMAEVGF